MKTPVIILLAFITVLIGLAMMLGLMYMSYSNNEIRLRNQIAAVQKDNENRYDNMWKKVSQAAQIPEAKKQAFKEIFTSYAAGRTGDGSKGSFINAVHESIPSIDLSIFDSLMNMIAGERTTWASNQTRLLDLKRAHDDALTTAPSSWFVGGRPPIDVKIVTSTRTEEAFQSGKDDDVQVFPKSK